MRFILVFALILLAGAAIAIDVNDCTVINAPGVYDLINNVVGKPNTVFGSDDACMVINSDDVELDCHGFSLTDDNVTGANAYGIVPTIQDNVTIRNCIVNQYKNGIDMYQVTNSLAENNTVSIDIPSPVSGAITGFHCPYTVNTSLISNYVTVSDDFSLDSSNSDGLNVIGNTFINGAVRSTYSDNGFFANNSFTNVSLISGSTDMELFQQNTLIDSQSIAYLPNGYLEVDNDTYVNGSWNVGVGFYHNGTPIDIINIGSVPSVPFPGMALFENKAVHLSLKYNQSTFRIYYTDADLVGHNETNMFIYLYNGSWYVPSTYHNFVENFIQASGLRPAVTYVAVFERVDFTAPVVSVNNPYYTNSNLIEVTAVDDFDPLMYCELDLDSVYNMNFTIANNSPTNYPVTMSEGPHTIDVDCRDELFQHGYANSTILYDVTPPAINIIHSNYTNNDTIQLNVTDAFDATLDCEMILDGSSFSNFSIANNTVTDYVMGFSYGPHDIEVYCQDDPGNTGNSNSSLIFDDVAPAVTLIAPPDGISTPITPYNFRFSAVEEYSNINCSLFINGNATVSNSSVQNGTETILQSAIGLGTNTWNVFCSDALGNTDSGIERDINRVNDDSGGGSTSGGGADYSITTSANCTHLTVKIFEDGSPVDGIVDVDGFSGWTDGGEVSIPVSCDAEYTASFMDASKTVTIDCSACVIECEADQVLEGEACVDRCDPGETWNGASCETPTEPPEECTDNEVLRNGECVEVECTADSDCGENQFCSGNSCEELGCGLIEDHQLVETYECDEGNPSCDGCRGNSICLDHSCVIPTLSVDECVVGTDCVGHADRGDNSGYVEIRDEEGNIVSQGSASDGLFRFLPAISGQYQVILYDQQGGEILLTTRANVLSPDRGTDDDNLTQGSSGGEIIAFVALFVIIVAMVGVYLMRRKR